MTMQLAALNGKDLMTKKQGTLWDKPAFVYFEFPHELQPNSQTQNKYAIPSPT